MDIGNNDDPSEARVLKIEGFVFMPLPRESEPVLGFSVQSDPDKAGGVYFYPTLSNIRELTGCTTFVARPVTVAGRPYAAYCGKNGGRSGRIVASSSSDDGKAVLRGSLLLMSARSLEEGSAVGLGMDDVDHLGRQVYIEYWEDTGIDGSSWDYVSYTLEGLEFTGGDGE